MNCKPGDLAVIVRSESGRSTGRLVEVVECAQREDVANGIRYNPLIEGPYWRIRGRVICMDRASGKFFELNEWFAADSQLRPLRDNPGEDETLTWAGKPEAVPA